MYAVTAFGASADNNAHSAFRLDAHLRSAAVAPSSNLRSSDRLYRTAANCRSALHLCCNPRAADTVDTRSIAHSPLSTLPPYSSHVLAMDDRPRQLRTAERRVVPSEGSRTITVTGSDDAAPPDSDAPPPVGVLHLRGTGGSTRRVVWTEETIDNEGLGKKKSKICCIYHKPKAFDESSDESSSSDSNSSDADTDEESASSNSSTSGVNASKTLRQKRAAAASAKGKEKSDEGQSGKACEHDECTHTHGTAQRKSAKTKKLRSNGRGGSRTVTITEPVETAKGSGDAIDEDRDGPRKRNAYEDGHS